MNAKQLGNEPIYPVNKEDIDFDIKGKPMYDIGSGLTKREYFAGLAMQGMLSNSDITSSVTNDQLANAAINQADELLKQLSK